MENINPVPAETRTSSKGQPPICAARPSEWAAAQQSRLSRRVPKTTPQTKTHFSPFSPLQAAASPSPADLPNALPHGCPAPQLPPFTPLTHSPPPALDPAPYGCPAEGWPCHPPSPYTPLACCCAACSPPHTDPKVPQRFPCPGTDCSGCLPPTDAFFRRDRSWDICYS